MPSVRPSHETRRLLAKARDISPSALRLGALLFAVDGRLGQPKAWMKFPSAPTGTTPSGVDAFCVGGLGGRHGPEQRRQLFNRMVDLGRSARHCWQEVTSAVQFASRLQTSDSQALKLRESLRDEYASLH